MNYLPRLIDSWLIKWKESQQHKPLLLRGARQVGKSWAVRNLGLTFKYFVEINFEKNPEYKAVFNHNLEADRLISQLSALTATPIIEGETLLFFDEIQVCKEAIMSLRFFKEDRPGLHVVAAGSLLEFTLAEIPTFGVGRIHSMYMYPMTFDEFLLANNLGTLVELKKSSSPENPLPYAIHQRLIEVFRTYILTGGMPEVVSKWVETNDYLQCQEIQDDIITGYEVDFSKYRKKVNPILLRNTFRSAASLLTNKFMFSVVPGNYKTYEVKKALDMLIMAGLLYKVNNSSANGLPLGSGTGTSGFKILTIDSGLTLRLLNFSIDNSEELTKFILTSTPEELVNKGSMAELIGGLEILRYETPNLHHELYYWTKEDKNSNAEVDYLIGVHGKVYPIEIKAGTQGGMKSLWMLMKLKGIENAARCSLENFGTLTHHEKGDEQITRHLLICPLYALSNLRHLATQYQR